jgi:calcium-dependent protein kinase
VSNLLTLEAKLRPTAVEAMQDEWITMHTAQDADNQSQEKKQLQRIMTGSERGTTFQKYLAMQKLKKAALVTIAKNLTHDEVGSLQDIFGQVDQSGDGVLSLKELTEAISVGTYIFLFRPTSTALCCCSG